MMHSPFDLTTTVKLSDGLEHSVPSSWKRKQWDKETLKSAMELGLFLTNVHNLDHHIVLTRANPTINWMKYWIFTADKETQEQRNKMFQQLIEEGSQDYATNLPYTERKNFYKARPATYIEALRETKTDVERFIEKMSSMAGKGSSGDRHRKLYYLYAIELQPRIHVHLLTFNSATRIRDKSYVDEWWQKGMTFVNEYENDEHRRNTIFYCLKEWGQSFDNPYHSSADLTVDRFGFKWPKRLGEILNQE